MYKRQTLLALDPSLTNTGWAVYTGGVLVASGCLGKVTVKSFYAKLTALLAQYSPDFVITEDVFCGPNKQTYKKLCWLQGVILSQCSPIIKTPHLWRAEWTAITGVVLPKGKGSGPLIKKLLQEHYSTKTNDEAEACAIGLTGITHE